MHMGEGQVQTVRGENGKCLGRLLNFELFDLEMGYFVTSALS